jgi:nickel/cobalt exporter
MMAAFIVAIRGTLKQAVLLGLAATLSHTAVVWIIAMAGLWFGRGWDAHTSEPWFQLISGVIDRCDRPVDGVANLEREPATRSSSRP